MPLLDLLGNIVGLWIQVFCDVRLCCWVSGVPCLEGSWCLDFQESSSLLELPDHWKGSFEIPWTTCPTTKPEPYYCITSNLLSSKSALLSEYHVAAERLFFVYYYTIIWFSDWANHISGICLCMVDESVNWIPSYFLQHTSWNKFHTPRSGLKFFLTGLWDIV